MKEHYATIDLGSNSFHMLTAVFEYQELKILDSISDKVMLAEGLTKTAGISDESKQRGLECIERFSQRLRSIPSENIRVVGTNTLRAAVNSDQYVSQLKAMLGNIPIEIISGAEEARLIYLGVSHTWSSINQQSKKFVIDIGGGSSEFIIGKSFIPLHVESLRMGCVTYCRFFPNGEITKKYFSNALVTAKLELTNITPLFKKEPWDHVIGSAGTFKAIERILRGKNICSEGISYKGLEVLKNEWLSYSNISQINLKGIKPIRRKTILPGLVIAIAIFETFGIERMQVSRGGLREGVLYDLVGRIKSIDIRERSIEAISHRYGQSYRRMALNRTIANFLLEQSMIYSPSILSENNKRFLFWALSCSQIGLAISHSQYQNHSSYLIENSELSGFTLNERAVLAAIVKNHRRKIRLCSFKKFGLDYQEMESLIITLFILRLVLIISQNGKKNQCKDICLKISPKKLSILLQSEWVEDHQLIHHAFKQEVAYWDSAGIELDIKIN